jgi:hypothetical protein
VAGEVAGSGKTSFETLKEDQGGEGEGWMEFAAVKGVSDEVRESDLGVEGGDSRQPNR